MTRTISRHPFVAAILATLVLNLSSAPASAQARWLGQKTKPFTNNKSAADVLEELATAHKFKVEYSSEAARTAAGTRTIFGNLEGIPLEVTVRLICGSDLPWTADNSTLTITDPAEMTTVTHSLARLGPVLNDPTEFRYAIMNTTSGDWKDPAAPPVADRPQGEILDLTASAIVVRERFDVQLEIADILNELRTAVSGGQSGSSSSSDKKIAKSLDKQIQWPAGEMLLSDLLNKSFTENRIPFFVLTQDLSDEGVDLSVPVKTDGKKGRVGEILDAALTDHHLAKQISSGVVLISTVDGIQQRRPVKAYDIRKFLVNATPEEIAAQVSSLDGVDDVDFAEPLGSFLLVSASSESHAKIAVAVAGK